MAASFANNYHRYKDGEKERWKDVFKILSEGHCHCQRFILCLEEATSSEKVNALKSCPLLSEVNQKKKDKYHMISLIYGI